ncbi:hypothetical protein, partial [Nonomuraea sp. NPDC003754]
MTVGQYETIRQREFLSRSPVEVATEVAVKQREGAVSFPRFFTEEEGARDDVPREVAASDLENMIFPRLDPGRDIPQYGARPIVVRNVDNELTVHPGGQHDCLHRFEEEFDVGAFPLRTGHLRPWTLLVRGDRESVPLGMKNYP